tara:strand:- start:117 stop:971 length:855 start_codon:yes stop_codon:yes gene_type:complete
MARLDIQNIDIDEAHVKIGGTSQTTASLNDSDIRSMADPDSTYAGSDGINTSSGSTIALGEFRNADHTSIDSFPSIGSWDTYNFSNWSTGNYTQAEAFCSMSFQVDTNHSRVIVTYYGGTNQSAATPYTAYIPYTGHTIGTSTAYGNQIFVKYDGNTPLVDANSGSTSYPPYGWPGNTSNNGPSTFNFGSPGDPAGVQVGPTGYHNSDRQKNMNTYFLIPHTGTVQFKWLIVTNASGYNNQQEHIFQSGVNFTVAFRGSNGTIYSTTSSSKTIELWAIKGIDIR